LKVLLTGKFGENMTMRRYEVVYVLAPILTEEEVEQYAETYSQAAREHGAEVINVDKWEKRKLAFRVKKYLEGYYTILTIEEEAADAVTELERRFKVNDAVIRFLTVRIDEDLKRAAKFVQDSGEEEEGPQTEEAAPKAAATAESEPEQAETGKAETGETKEKTAGGKAKAKAPEVKEAETDAAEKKSAKKQKSPEKDAEPAAKKDVPADVESKDAADEKPVEKPEEEKENG
jgi:small subunit ribosomal protein S6